MCVVCVRVRVCVFTKIVSNTLLVMLLFGAGRRDTGEEG